MNAQANVVVTSRLLTELPKGTLARVVDVGGDSTSGVASHLIRRLSELGFLRGETVKVIRRVAGGEPIAVRVGSSTFALRRYEAECIRVEPLTT